MKRNNIGFKTLSSGFSLPVYGFGTWKIGGGHEADTTHDAADIASLRAALDAGVTHFDTAEGYGSGHAEELLGQAIAGYDRQKLIIASKVSPENQGYDGVRRALAASLRRLQTDYVDLYLLHRYPAPGISITETLRGLDELVDQGIIKHLGASNMTPRRFAAAQQASRHKLVCNQVHYSVQYREIERAGVLKYCQENDVLLVAWRPLQKGALPSSPLLIELARQYNKTPNQVALNWLLSQKNVVVLSKTSRLEHLQENLGATGWSLTPADVERIRQEFPDQQFVSDVVPLDYPAALEP